MASRAFFRCRACGEPVVAGAYRCPVCAIDFPTGTPGAPARPDASAVVERARPARPDEPRPAATARIEGTVPAHVIAARLDQALVEELVAPDASIPAAPAPAASVPAASFPAGSVPAAPGRAAQGEAEPEPPLPEASWAKNEGGLDDVVPAVSDPDGPVGIGPGARLDAVPERASDLAPAAALSLSPGRDRAPKPAPSREKVPALREAPHELVPVRRRRNKSTKLAVTIALALLVLCAIGAGTYLLDGARIMNIGGTAPPTAAAPLTVRAADGWVDVAAGEGVMVITSTGPYRLRIDGVVYTVSGEKSVRVPMASGTSLALRTAGEGTVAEVRPAPADAPAEAVPPR